MDPYYDEDGITIYHGDCREIIDKLDCDVIITDPPYGKNYYPTDVDVFDATLLSSWTNRFDTLMCFGWPENLVRLCVESSLIPDEWIVWHPTNGALRGFNRSGLRRESEHIAVFGEVEWSSLRASRGSLSRWIVKNRQQYGKALGDVVPEETKRESDVWTDASPNLGFHAHRRLHPNEKPLGILTRLVSVVDGCIIDPFMGSGTTLRAAKDLGRKAIGIEIEERYCEIAVERLAQGVLEFG